MDLVASNIHIEEDFKYDENGALHGPYFHSVEVNKYVVKEIYGQYDHGNRQHTWTFVDYDTNCMFYTLYKDNKPIKTVSLKSNGSTHIRWLD